MIKRLLQTTIVLVPPIALYISRRIGLSELSTIPVAIAIYYIIYNSRQYHAYQDTVIKLHPQFPDTRILSITDIVEYLCIRTHAIPAAITMVIAVYKMTVLLFEHLIITGKPITLGVQLISEEIVLSYMILSILTWLSCAMLYPAFRWSLYKYRSIFYEKYNLLIEGEGI